MAVRGQVSSRLQRGFFHVKHRKCIERHFCRIKHFRRIATRYEKLAPRFASFVAAFVWLT